MSGVPDTVATRAVPPDSVESYLWSRVPRCFPSQPAVHRIVDLTAGVWDVQMEGGARVVAKHQGFGEYARGRADDLLNVESEVLRLLADERCPVPNLLGTDPDTQFIFFEHRGQPTADDFCQDVDSTQRMELAEKVVQGFCRIEAALFAHQEDLLDLLTSAGTISSLRQRDAASVVQAQDALCRLGHLFPAAIPGHGNLDELLQAIAGQLSSRRPTLGSMDYNARNIVVDEETGEPSFIEFAKIGWDWPERRLVQYATSLGAGRDKGEFIEMMSARTVRLYASCVPRDLQGRAFALDGHRILFLLNAAAMLSGAIDDPQKPAHKALLHAWRHPRHRLMQLLGALASPVSDDPLCCKFRACFETDQLRLTREMTNE